MASESDPSRHTSSAPSLQATTTPVDGCTWLLTHSQTNAMRRNTRTQTRTHCTPTPPTCNGNLQADPASVRPVSLRTSVLPFVRIEHANIPQVALPETAMRDYLFLMGHVWGFFWFLVLSGLNFHKKKTKGKKQPPPPSPPQRPSETLEEKKKNLRRVLSFCFRFSFPPCLIVRLVVDVINMPLSPEDTLGNSSLVLLAGVESLLCQGFCALKCCPGCVQIEPREEKNNTKKHHNKTKQTCHLIG